MIKFCESYIYEYNETCKSMCGVSKSSLSHMENYIVEPKLPISRIRYSFTYLQHNPSFSAGVSSVTMAKILQETLQRTKWPKRKETVATY